MKLWTLFLAVLCSGIGLGCAPKRVTTNLVIELHCLTAPVELRNCDLSDPPRCKQSKITYRKGCERVVVGK